MDWEGTTRLGPLWDELHRRMGASGRPVRRVQVIGLDDAGRRTLASLLGLNRLPDGPAVAVPLSKLAEGLGLDDLGLRVLVERLRGRLDNRAAARAAEALARAELWAEAETRLGSRIPATLARIRIAGVPDRDIAAHRRILGLLADAIARLPSDPPVPMPMLAWELTGDPHALDHKSKLAGMLYTAAVELAGRAAVAESEAIRIRASLHALGVIPDRLSTPTITLGLRAATETSLGRLLEAAAEVRVPATIPGALLDTGVPRFHTREWLCVENPSVVEAAAAAGTSRAIVCTSGWASADVQRLLGSAREQGIQLAYAGDYDGEGLKIAAWMSARFGARIEMTADVYNESDLDRAPPWHGEIPNTQWEAALAEAIHSRRRVVYQEDPRVWRTLIGA